MKLLWRPRAWEDYERWRRSDPAIWKMINALVKDIQQTPYEGLGRPKALQYDFEGWWSREITDKHRFRYRIKDGVLEIAQCYGGTIIEGAL